MGKELGKELGERETLVEVVTMLLTTRFGEEGLVFAAELANVENTETLRAVLQAGMKGEPLDELRSLADR